MSNQDAIKVITDQFSNPYLYQGQKLLEQGRISVSFLKGKLDRFFIISGIIADANTNYEGKITFKVSEPQLPGKLTTQCTCNIWTETGHCPHIAGLWLKYKKQGELELKNSRSHFIPSLQDGVHPERYGTHIKQPQHLVGAKLGGTFASLQYTLTNQKIVNLPQTQSWQGELIVNLVKATHFEEFEKIPSYHDKYVPEFKFKTSEDEIIKEISLFDTFYLFNWKTGEAYKLSREVTEFVRKISLHSPALGINEFLKWLPPNKVATDLSVEIEGIALGEIPFVKHHYRFSINTHSRKNFLALDLEVWDENQRLLAPNPLFSLMGTENGFGQYFRSKTDALNFLSHLAQDFEFDTTNYKKYIHSNPKKAFITDWIEALLENEKLMIYDVDTAGTYLIDKNIFKHLFTTLQNIYKEHAFKSTFIHLDEKKMTFLLPKNILLDSVHELYQKISPLEIELFYNNSIVKSWRSNIRFERNQNKLDWFELDLLVSDEDLSIIKNADIKDNYLISQKGLVLLTDKEKDLLRFMKRYTKLEGEKKGQGLSQYRRFGLSLQRARIFELFELKKLGIEGALTSEEERFCEEILTLENMPDYPVPERYQKIARPYQVTGYQWLRFLFEHRFGACLADDMGLGKTLQTIMFLDSIKDKIENVLIVCPVSILHNWQKEIEKFSELKFSVFHGNEREIEKDSKITLTSYGIMKKESEETFKGQKFDVIIFDEVQHLKNIKSQGAQAARKINADFRLCLTGTPVENDVSEFYNIIDLCVPGVWGDMSYVRSSIRSNSRLYARKTVRPFILRRTKEQVLTELPEKIENYVYLDFADEERNRYEDRLKYIKGSVLSTQMGKRYGEVLKSLLELRQLCLWQDHSRVLSSKVDFLMENLEQLMEEGHKVLIFSQFTTYLEIIQNKIREHNWKYSRIDGSLSTKKRAQAVEDFQNGENQIFLISLKAGGFGLNLTAASYIFLMDPWWNPAVESQAIDRAHRIGQENKLTVYRPIIKGSVEEKVLLLQQNKRELFNDLMANDDGEFFNGKLTMDDFKELLS